MNTAKSDLPQETLDMLILRVASLGPIHGYAIAQGIQQGLLYPAPHSMETRGLLSAEWKESETGRDAKFYRLTAAGRRQFQVETGNWARLAEAVGLILTSEGGAQ